MGKYPIRRDQVDPVLVAELTASSQAQMLSLTAVVGDYCYRSDNKQLYRLETLPASTLSNWQPTSVSEAERTSWNAKENQSNKSNSFSILNNTLYPTTQAVSDFVTGLVNTRLDKSGDTITGNINNTATGFFRVPVGTTAQRPSSPTDGMMRWNTTNSRLEFFSAGAWRENVRREGDTGLGSYDYASHRQLYFPASSAGNNYTNIGLPNADSTPVSDTTPHITLESFQKALAPEHWGESLRLDFMDDWGKSAIAFRDARPADAQGKLVGQAARATKAWLVAHYKANGYDTRPIHKHFSIELTDLAGLLQTRMEFPYDQDVCMIRVVDSTFFVVLGNMGVVNNLNGGSGFNFQRQTGQILSGQADERYNGDSEKLNRWKFQISNGAETGSDAQSNLYLSSWNDAGQFKTNIMRWIRSTGFVGIGVASDADISQRLTVQGSIRAQASPGAGQTASFILNRESTDQFAVLSYRTNDAILWDLRLTNDGTNTWQLRNVNTNVTAIAVGSSNNRITFGQGTTSGGIVLPTFTTGNRDAIASPIEGLKIWNQTTKRVNVHNGTNWLEALYTTDGDNYVTKVSIKFGNARTQAGTQLWGLPNTFFTALSTATLAANEIRYAHFFVPTTTTVSAMRFAVTTAPTVNGNVRIGLYNCDTDLQPTTLVDDSGNIAIASTTVSGTTFTYTPATAITLQPGWYCIAMNTDQATTVRVFTYPTSAIDVGLGATSLVQRVQVASAFGAYATTGLKWTNTTLSAGGAQTPIVMQYTV